MILRTIVLIALLPGIFSTRSAIAQDNDRLSVAFLHAQGMLVPFGHYDNNEWVHIEYDQEKWANLGLDSTWYYYSWYGSQGLIKPDHIADFRGGDMGPSWGYKIDFSPSITDTLFWPKLHIGIAFSQEITPFFWSKYEQIDSTSQEVGEIIRDEFNRILNERNINLEVEAGTCCLWISDRFAGDQRLLHFRQSHTVWTESESGRWPSYYTLEGWLHEEKGEQRLLNVLFSRGDSDGKGLGPQVDPFAVFLFNEEIYVATVVWYYEGRSNTILKLSDQGLVEQLGVNVWEGW